MPPSLGTKIIPIGIRRGQGLGMAAPLGRRSVSSRPRAVVSMRSAGRDRWGGLSVA